MAHIVGIAVLAFPWIPVAAVVLVWWRRRRARRQAALEVAAAPRVHHVEARTVPVRVGGFHACVAPNCGLRRPHPCHDISCPRRASGTCSPIRAIGGGRA